MRSYIGDNATATLIVKGVLVGTDAYNSPVYQDDEVEVSALFYAGTPADDFRVLESWDRTIGTAFVSLTDWVIGTSLMRINGEEWRVVSAVTNSRPSGFRHVMPRVMVSLERSDKKDG